MTDTSAKPVAAQAAAKPTRVRDLKDINFTNLKTELENIRSASGESLYAHLQKVFEHMILHNPDKALERFEEISYMIKQGMDPNEFICCEDNRDYKQVAGDREEYCKKIAPHFAQPEPDEEGVVPQADPLATQVQDLMSESRIFAWAGIGFGEQEYYRLQKSIKKLAAAKPHKALRFFGKIYGTVSDYYVIEAQGDGGDEGEEEEPPAEDGGEPDPRIEAKGTGVNELTYYVACDSLSEWKRLPDLSYKDLIAARTVKVLFTGDLERPIFTNPFFFGREKHYLRAQLSRIIHSTTLQPMGVSKLEEDEGAERLFQVVPNEGEEDKPFVMPSTRQMSDKSMWVHSKPNILINGRTTHIAPEDPGDLPEGEEFDPEEAKKKMESADPYDPLLKKITDDAQVSTGGKVKCQAWSVRICGDTTEYSQFDPAQKAPRSNAVVVVRSMCWPGAYSFFFDGKVQQIYLGNGHKFGQETSNFPVNPPMVMADPEEYEDGPEPTPLEAPVDINETIAKIVEETWAKHDTEDAGSLEKEQMTQFVKDTLAEMPDSPEFDEEAFEGAFAEFEKEESGKIEKDVAVAFIKKVAGLKNDGEE